MATRQRTESADKAQSRAARQKGNADATKNVVDSVRHADEEKVRAAGARAIARWAGLLRRLSE